MSRWPRRFVYSRTGLVRKTIGIQETKMANYHFLMQLNNIDYGSLLNEEVVIKMSIIGSALSLICCVMALCLLSFLPVYGIGISLLRNMVIALMAAQLSFIGSENTSSPNKIICKIATCLIQYFFLCVHFTSLAYGIHLMSKFTRSCILNHSRRRMIYTILTWGIPLVITSITFLFRGSMYATSKLCWLPSEDLTTLAFLIPVYLIMLFNGFVLILVITARVILDIQGQKSVCDMIRNVFCMLLSALPALSLTWVCGVAVTLNVAPYIQYTFILMASPQGMFLLVFSILPTKQIKLELLAKLKPDTSEESKENSTGVHSSKILSKQTKTSVTQDHNKDQAEEQNEVENID